MPRLNKRQQRELEPLRGLETVQGLEGKQSLSDDDHKAAPVLSRTAFAALEVMEVDDEEEHIGSSTAKKSKKKRGKKNQEELGEKTNTQSKAGARRTEAKKSKAPVNDSADLSLDELILDDFPTHPPPSRTPPHQKFRELLAVSLVHLDGDAELRRFFGAKVISSAKLLQNAAPSPSGLSSRNRRALGLSMPALLPEDSWWTVDHSNPYKEVQHQFLSVVEMGDHAGFVQILREHPWHIDTLLQMSEVARHHEEHAQASDFVQRAIFAFERSFGSAFNFTAGSCRLDFDHIENRSFFLALHRHIIDLQRRGTIRTAFEFSRLLLSLDPIEDPHGALFHLDYLAMNVELIPGWWWSRALAIWNLETSKGDKTANESTQALQEAIKAYPQVLPILADKAGIGLSSQVRGHQAFRIATGWDSFDPGESTVNLLSHLYAHRSADVWKQPNVSSWLVSAIDAKFLNGLTSEPSPTHAVAVSKYSSGTPQNITRHVIVTEIRSLFSFLEPQTLAGSMAAYDPIPPVTSVSRYDESYFRGVSRRRANRGQNAGPGIDDEMQQRMIQEMIFAEIQRQQQRETAMPGEFDQQPPNQVDVNSEEQEAPEGEGIEENENLQFDIGARLLQAMYNVIWGSGRQNDATEPATDT
ncbi:transcriptional repressor TCF25-domain-containing protein [Cantharellus anzutake]|uniref:transcriptional repressor TCF25-domain-containing protein n=1 Tax=Cantharellus anzutake TaxID=1750568 RepID=UPI0019054A06|nr:transcriptional repressor TCF25-domain-containing protein [Cantharellus anzutake]KAF8341438.1 transcriptional repressor TCF25-domain-containing protein [Cantharellus anzutake]